MKELQGKFQHEKTTRHQATGAFLKAGKYDSTGPWVGQNIFTINNVEADGNSCYGSSA